MRIWILAALAVVLAAGNAAAFALYGPLTAEDTWQRRIIGFQELAGDGFYGNDIATPRNLLLGHEYRWNTPILVYAFDASFQNSHGTDGIVEVEKAIAMLNALTNVSSYSADLSEFPLDTSRVNPRAAALGLIDLKSETLSLMLEELGLGSAERWSWCLHDRVIFNGDVCPTVFYQLVQRNYDPVTRNPTSYVNGTLYTFFIDEICQATGGRQTLADAIELIVDPFTTTTAIAGVSLYGGFLGRFYTGLTRDDVGGLRYMWSTNNLNTEGTDGLSELVSGGSVGGGTTFTTITTSNLADLVSAAATNNPTQLAALFPGLVISSSSFSFPVIVSSNVFSYFTNYPYAPFGTPASLVTAITYSSNVQQRWSYVFGNVVTNSVRTNGLVTVTTTNVANNPNAPVGTPPSTNVSSVTTLQNFINGDYYLIPTNQCGFVVLSNLLTQVMPVPLATINPVTAGATNVLGVIGQNATAYFTNHVLLVQITECLTNSAGGAVTNAAVLRQGIGRIQFVRGYYDSDFGQTMTPVTNTFAITAVINSVPVVQTFRRTVTQPDFLFTAADLSGDLNTGQVLDYSVGGRSIPNFVPGGPIGPGLITAPVTITYNSSGPIYENSSPFFLDEAHFFALVRFAAFDGTTNAPIIFPNGTSVQELENRVFMQISPGTLPDGQVTVGYNQTLTGNGGHANYTFTLTPNSPGLPPGLTFTGGTNVLSATIAGTPTTAGTYDFSVRMTDQVPRTIDVIYTITVNP